MAGDYQIDPHIDPRRRSHSDRIGLISRTFLQISVTLIPVTRIGLTSG